MEWLASLLVVSGAVRAPLPPCLLVSLPVWLILFASMHMQGQGDGVAGLPGSCVTC
jgi:hypothetical protein